MNRFAGTGTLTRLALRRDRMLLPAWVAVFVLVNWFSAVASKDLYPSTAALQKAGEGWNATTALVALHGRIDDTTSLGAGSLVKMTGLGTAMVALLALLLRARRGHPGRVVVRTADCGRRGRRGRASGHRPVALVHRPSARSSAQSPGAP